MFRYYATDSFSPVNYNWGHWANAEATDSAAQGTGDIRSGANRPSCCSKAHAIVVDEAPWLFIVHDLNPRALSPKVPGSNPAQSWSQDFTQISMADEAHFS